MAFSISRGKFLKWKYDDLGITYGWCRSIDRSEMIDCDYKWNRFPSFWSNTITRINHFLRVQSILLKINGHVDRKIKVKKNVTSYKKGLCLIDSDRSRLDDRRHKYVWIHHRTSGMIQTRIILSYENFKMIRTQIT